MSELKFVTKGNASPKDKPKVYFTCHPKDFKRSFEEICKDIFETYDCAIFYTEDMTTQLDDENRELDLYQMNLFVMPISFALLTEPNRAMDEDFVFATEKHIPILPIMLESGIDSIYAEKFGERQYLEPYSTDATGISYKEKLKNYLNSVFLDKETIERIRKAFDAYIFLSYRKKDRRYANELMRMIHNRPELEKLAIWYDEFLTPGESFMENIQKIMTDSKLMTLLVTPNLLEMPDGKPNFVMDKEYPAARDSGKPVLPAEMVKTDSESLKQAYQGLPDAIDIRDEKTFNEAFIEALKQHAVSANRNDPEHNYLVGLAYLDGIDVETDKERAVKMITAAAEAELPEAMAKLYHMYNDGIGVNLNYNTSLNWAKKLYDYYLRENGEKDEDTLIWLNNLSLAYGGVGEYAKMLPLIEECYRLRAEVSGKKDAETLTALSNLAFAYGKVGDHTKSLSLDEQCYKLRYEELGEKHPDTLLSLNNLAMAYGSVGNYTEMLPLIEKCYQLRLEISGKRHPETLRSLNNLAFAYGNIGNYTKSLSLYEECYRLKCKELGEKHPDTLTSLNNLALAYGNVGNYAKQLSLTEKCYQLRLEISGKRHPETLRSLNNLAFAYGNIGNYTKSLSLYEECYRLKCKELGEKHPDTLTSLNNLALTYDDVGDYAKSLPLHERCYQLRCEVFRKHHRDTLDSLQRIGIARILVGDYRGAAAALKPCYISMRKVRGKKEDKTVETLKLLQRAYRNAGNRWKTLIICDYVYCNKWIQERQFLENTATFYSDYHKVFKANAIKKRLSQSE